MVHPDDQEWLYTEFQKNIDENAIETDLEFRILSDNGSQKWVRMASIVDMQEKEQRVNYGIFTDVTDRKNAEAETEGIVQAIGNASGVIEMDTEGKLLNVNQTIADLLGYEREELIDTNHLKICPNEYSKSAEYKELREKVMSGDFMFETFRRIAKDGSTVWLQGVYSPILDLEGKVYKIMFFAQDATNRREQNSENRGKLQALDRAMAVMELDLEGNILNLNKEYEESLGYGDEIVGKNFYSLLVHKDISEENYKSLLNELKSNRIVTDSFKNVTQKGEEIWMEGSLNPITNYDGKVIKITAYMQNITERRARNSENRGKLKAIDLTNGVIEFELDGTIITANKNFLDAVGYAEGELAG